MPFDTPASALYFGIALQLLGLGSMLAARLSEGCRLQKSCQRLFLFTLVQVGWATIVVYASGNIWWPSFAVTLSLMIVGATLDLSSDAEQIETGPVQRI